MPTFRRNFGIVFGAFTLCAVPEGAQADPGLFVGATEDAFRWRSTAAVAVSRDLGLTAFRVTLSWTPGQWDLSAADAAAFDAMIPAASGLRIVVTVYGPARAAPLDAGSRDAFCSYTRRLLERYPTINDVVIWNEPNLGFFWQPQFDPGGTSIAPAAYGALLARCWDVLHAFRRDVNILTTTSPSGNDNATAVSNVSHSPGTFVRKLGDAYRASRRSARLFDTIGHNPYGRSSAESPWQQHLSPTHVGQGDVDRLVQAFDLGFRGTQQPVPGRCAGTPRHCLSIWYLEAGYQTVPGVAHRTAYVGRENDSHPIEEGGGVAPEPNQSTQLTDGIRLAYCQPFVGAFFNFLLWDEVDLARWQSGVLWADGGRKASYHALQRVVGEVNERRVDCARVKAVQSVSSQPGPDALVERIEWSPSRTFSSFNEIWTFAIAARTDATFRASILRIGSERALLTRSGSLKQGQPRTVRFSQRRLRAGSYRIEIALRSARAAVTRRSPTFVVS